MRLYVHAIWCGMHRITSYITKYLITMLIEFKPHIIYVDDYHEFSYLEKFYRKIDKRISVEEIQLSKNRQYAGIVFLAGSKSSPEYKQVRKDFINQEKEFNVQTK